VSKNFADNFDYNACEPGSIKNDIHDSKFCQGVTELVRETESDLLFNHFNHSSRVYCFGALTDLRRVLSSFDRELLAVS
jgi:hypothetical protein